MSPNGLDHSIYLGDKSPNRRHLSYNNVVHNLTTGFKIRQCNDINYIYSVPFNPWRITCSKTTKNCSRVDDSSVKMRPVPTDSVVSISVLIHIFEIFNKFDRSI